MGDGDVKDDMFELNCSFAPFKKKNIYNGTVSIVTSVLMNHHNYLVLLTRMMNDEVGPLQLINVFVINKEQDALSCVGA